jgi:hypothetical protein
MNRIWPWLAALVLILVIGGAYLISVTPFQADQEAAVRKVVEAFGDELKDVSLLAPKEDVAAQMQANYAAYIASELLVQWENDPANAPGRLTSSPWPERIEIRTMTKESDLRYSVEGDIVEVTNEGGGIGEMPTEAARRPVSMTVEKRGGDWLITTLTMGAYPGDGEWTLSAPDARGLQFMYPTEMPTTYISAQTWPPLVELVANEYACTEGPITAADGPLKETTKHMVGDREYCVTLSSEAAAGSAYRTYEYVTEQGDFVARVVFTLRFPQCMNYDQPEQGLCASEQANFDIDGVVDRIASSIRMP